MTSMVNGQDQIHDFIVDCTGTEWNSLLVSRFYQVLEPFFFFLLLHLLFLLLLLVLLFLFLLDARWDSPLYFRGTGGSHEVRRLLVWEEGREETGRCKEGWVPRTKKASWHDFARGMPYVPSFSTGRRRERERDRIKEEGKREKDKKREREDDGQGVGYTKRKRTSTIRRVRRESCICEKKGEREI